MLVEEYEDGNLMKGAYYKKNQAEPISTIRNGNGVAHLYDEEGIFSKKVIYAKGKLASEAKQDFQMIGDGLNFKLVRIINFIKKSASMCPKGQLGSRVFINMQLQKLVWILVYLNLNTIMTTQTKSLRIFVSMHLGRINIIKQIIWKKRCRYAVVQRMLIFVMPNR
jgi:hypothetical protein